MKESFRKVGFFMLGVLSLLYIIFSRNFAEIRIQFPFFDFPVFIGEIFLALFFILSFFLFDFRSLKGWQWGVVFYFACVIAKALWGYSLWGPLAFRHAALFYYPVFIFFGFIFYKRDFLSTHLKIFIAFLILSLCLQEYLYGYWILTLSLIAFIVIRLIHNSAMKYLFYGGLAAVIFISHKVFIMTSRTFIVGNIIAAVFLVMAFLYIAKIKGSYKLITAGVIFIFLSVFVYRYSSLNASGTIVNIKTILNKYRVSDNEIKFLQPGHVPLKLSGIKLFNPEKAPLFNLAGDKMPEKQKLRSRDRENIEEMSMADLKDKGQQKETPDFSVKKDIEESRMTAASGNKAGAANNSNNAGNGKPIAKGRVAEDAYGNILFRLFIWRDMFFEYLEQRPIFGFSFGRPLRSVSLEILNWGNGDWMRDGWIEPHNSYLNILYRMGILGAALICFLIWQFCSIMKSFISLKSSTGILLCSVLIAWLPAANFLPIFELPYSAIPFWAFWGVTLGYLKELQDKR